MFMGSSTPKASTPAAPAKASSLDIKRAQNEAEEKMRKRRGFAQSTYAGLNTGNLPQQLG